MIGWIAIIILVVLAGITYGWTSLDEIVEGTNAVMQIADSDQAQSASLQGQDLLSDVISFLQERYQVYQANNPWNFQPCLINFD